MYNDVQVRDRSTGVLSARRSRRSSRLYSTRTRAAATLISMGFTSLLPPPMTSWKVISCPINPAVAGSRAELRRIYDVWNRWFGSLVALRHTDDFLSVAWCGLTKDRRLRSFILDGPYVYVPEITPPAQVGWFVSCQRGLHVDFRLGSRLSLLTFPRDSCLFHIPLFFVEYIVRLRNMCIYTFRPLHMPHCLDISLETALCPLLR